MFRPRLQLADRVRLPQRDHLQTHKIHQVHPEATPLRRSRPNALPHPGARVPRQGRIPRVQRPRPEGHRRRLPDTDVALPQPRKRPGSHPGGHLLHPTPRVPRRNPAHDGEPHHHPVHRPRQRKLPPRPAQGDPLLHPEVRHQRTPRRRHQGRLPRPNAPPDGEVLRTGHGDGLQLSIKIPPARPAALPRFCQDGPHRSCPNLPQAGPQQPRPKCVPHEDERAVQRPGRGDLSRRRRRHVRDGVRGDHRVLGQFWRVRWSRWRCGSRRGLAAGEGGGGGDDAPSSLEDVFFLVILFCVLQVKIV
uniref:(northern house mosquito) hypothetical protein n=1 Tax=Culex pipiens TaxID=7175 RepID=A0A8D8CDY4_CULPI